MIRSNSKKAVENIRKYIIEQDADYLQERADEEGRTLSTEDSKGQTYGIDTIKVLNY